MSDIWDTYANRITVRGKSVREDNLEREKLRIRYLIEDSLSYHSVCVYEKSIIDTNEKDEEINVIKQDVAIINSDNLDEKYLYTLPDETIYPGDLVQWMDNYWIVTEKDANVEIYTRAKLKQCNYILKWVEMIDDVPTIMEQWCYVEDGTKYMTGELEDRHFIVTRGDARIAITIGRNPHTAKFNRKSRFLVDDPMSEYMLSFDLSKPLKAGHTYNDRGIYQFVLSESNSSVLDNMELGIADYYAFFPKENEDSNLVGEAIVGSAVVTSHPSVAEERKVWL